MNIERTSTEIIIKLPATTEIADLQRFLDYLSYKQVTKKSKASQKDVDLLAKEAKSSWWKKNRENRP